MRTNLSTESKSLISILEGELETESDQDVAIEEIQSLIGNLLKEGHEAMTIRNANTVGSLLAYGIDPTEKTSKAFLKFHRELYRGTHVDGDDFYSMEAGDDGPIALVFGAIYFLSKCEHVSTKHAAAARKLINRMESRGLIPKGDEIER